MALFPRRTRFLQVFVLVFFLLFGTILLLSLQSIDRSALESAERQKFLLVHRGISAPYDFIPPQKPSVSREDPLLFADVKLPPLPDSASSYGSNGRSVKIHKEELPLSDQKKWDEGWKKHSFNLYISDKMSLHRSLPDVRPEGCRSDTHPSELPDTSIIICFHNEAWSVLLRTVHSIFDRSPPNLVNQVILVDDFSTMTHLRRPLEMYMAKLGRVKIVRASKREGLVRARLKGAAVAKGKVLTFLDSHCECTEGWLEPMLARIAIDRKIVVCPVIDVIDEKTFAYQYGSAEQTNVGGFDWGLQFTWHGIPTAELSRRKNSWDPLRSPTMAGGLFAIDRKYFYELGSYDKGMEIWGGENLEMSFRIWMCGGSLEIIPCSHVGHIFRSTSPYSWAGKEDAATKNAIRVAEVWLDEFKQYYYEKMNMVRDPHNFGDISDRIALRRKLKCHNFKWYLQHVYPELFAPNTAIASGDVCNPATNLCLDGGTEEEDFGKELKAWPRHGMGGNQLTSSIEDTENVQLWYLSPQYNIRRDEGCIEMRAPDRPLFIAKCFSNDQAQIWTYNPRDASLKHTASDMCIAVVSDQVVLRSCDSENPRQKWDWKMKQ